MQTKSIHYKVLLTFEQQCRSFRIRTELGYICLIHFAIALNSILSLLNLKQSSAYCSFSRSVSLLVSTPSPRGQSQRPSSSLSCQGSPHFILCRLAMCCFYLFYFSVRTLETVKSSLPSVISHSRAFTAIDISRFEFKLNSKQASWILDMHHRWGFSPNLIGQHSVLSCLFIFHVVSFSDDV